MYLTNFLNSSNVCFLISQIHVCQQQINTSLFNECHGYPLEVKRKYLVIYRSNGLKHHVFPVILRPKVK